MNTTTIVLIAISIILIFLMIGMCSGSKFKSKFKKVNDTVLVFFMPGCPHCDSAMPEFKKAAGQNENIKLLNSELPEVQKIAKQMNIEGFPTIVKPDGTTHNGERTAEAIIDFSKK